MFKNGYVYTVNPGDRVAHAVAVKGRQDRLRRLQRRRAAFVGPSTKVVKLDGKMVLPGFIDSHMHASMTVSSLYSVLLYGLTSVDEYTAAVAEFVTAHPEMDVIRGQGWSNTVVPDLGPLASDLDKVVSDKPVSIMSEDGHSYWVNSKALELAGITGKTADPVNGVIERLPGSVDADNPYGVPSGTLRETAADLVNDLLPDYTVQQYKDGFAYFQQEVAAPLGLTTVFDPLMYVGGNGVQALEEMSAAGELTVRVRAALSLTPADDLGSWLTAARAERAKHTHAMFKTPAVKIFADGVVEGHTAYLNEPYADALEYKGDASYRGEPIWPSGEDEADLREARQGRLPDPHARHRRRGHHGDPGRARLRAEGQRQARLAARHHPHPARRPQGLQALRQARRDGRPRPVLVHQGRLLHVPAGAVPRPAAGGPRVPDEELLRRRRRTWRPRATTRSPSRRTR